ncbi:MAG: EMC3/TMCO1 family protein [Nanoarchaeota archaeon]|nr:EMC3/TMCO1 family protein [Nanoarchaeota archaeon]
MKGIKIMILVMLASIVLAIFWDQVPLIKETVHFVLDPTAGKLLSFNIDFGLILITAIITLAISLVQKYTVDNDTLRELKKEQKLVQEEMKKYKDHPEKLMELQKKQLEFIPKTMDLTMRPLIYTAIPIILFFRWFNDYFAVSAAGTTVKIFGILSWFWAYLIFSIIFSLVFRKVLKLP